MRGAEPDACFYVANAERIIGKRKIDLNRGPPPDIAVEIDTTNESLSKFAIYATFMVQEIWRYDVNGNRVLIYELRDQSYVEVSSSRSFSILTGDVIANFIDQSKTQGQRAALVAFQRWIRATTRR